MRRPSTLISSCAGIRFRAHLADGVAVHGDASLGDQLLGRAPRRDAGLSKNLLQPL